ncbi:4Fe-4S binding protein [Geomesophilobacter sediminis]|uniref:4Fe-4S binding protein n=1 Tax=Geomesophilobacter sediminis TaxID=2798584 RepID=A0A8J7M4N9_9BACT|nr:4Fe-4S binding protein [Geomesophilobacter sediminis]MBJ6727893.1 4Fe-4S binding protein [Geomesophilobacter sediminis]
MPNQKTQPVRIAVQWAFLLFSLYLGFAFYRFVLHFRSGGATAFVSRPDGVEAFLPISALVSLKAWLVSGEINSIHPAGLVIFLTILLLSLVLKRAFCSWICPVATVSEVMWKLGQKALKRNFQFPRYLDLALRGVKFLLLFFFLFTVVGGMSGLALQAFILSDYNKMADVKMLDFFLNLSGTGLIVIGTLLVLSVFFRNPFCRFICPYGALLGLLSRLSPVKVERVASACISCGGCNRACPSHLDVMQSTRVGSEECIGCLRCVDNCPKPEALQLRLKGGKIVGGMVFAALVVVLFVGGSLVGRATGHWHTSMDRAEYQRLFTLPEIPHL